GLSGAGDPGSFADVGERAVAVVVVEDVLSVVGDVEIGVAVVVVVADAHALSPPGMNQAGYLGDIGESAIVVVAIEMVGGRLAGRECLVELGAFGDEVVGPAVIVVVENGDPSAGGLDDVFLGGDPAEDVAHGETRFGGVVDKECERLSIAGDGRARAGGRCRRL